MATKRGKNGRANSGSGADGAGSGGADSVTAANDRHDAGDGGAGVEPDSQNLGSIANTNGGGTNADSGNDAAEDDAVVTPDVAAAEAAAAALRPVEPPQAPAVQPERETPPTGTTEPPRRPGRPAMSEADKRAAAAARGRKYRERKKAAPAFTGADYRAAAAPAPAAEPAAPQLTPAELDALVVTLAGMVDKSIQWGARFAARRRGAHWLVDPAESAELGRAWGEGLAPYVPTLAKYAPLAMAGVATFFLLEERFAEDDRLAALGIKPRDYREPVVILAPETISNAN